MKDIVLIGMPGTGVGQADLENTAHQVEEMMRTVGVQL